MYNVRKVTDKITWIGGEDRRLALFESVYPIPNGVSYNSYFIDDEKTLVMDTVDKSVSGQFFENLERIRKMEKELDAQLLFGHDFQQIQEWAAKGWIE